MITDVVQLGNSRGIRIPKAVLEQAGLENQVELEVRGSQVVIRALRHPRANWDAAFAAMAARGDGALLDPPRPTKWDESQWQWGHGLARPGRPWRSAASPYFPSVSPQ